MTERSKRDVAVDLLTSPWPWLLALPVVILLFVLVVIFQPEMPTVVVPRAVKVGAFAVLAAGAVGYMPTSKILDWLYDPPKRILVQPGVTADESHIWKLSPTAFSDLTLDEDGGQLYQWPGTEYPTYEVEWYNEETHTAKGTWRGSAPDSKLLDREQEIDEVRTELEAKARERDVLVTRAERIVREEILANTRQLIQEYNRQTIVDVQRLQKRLDKAMGDHSLEGNLERFKRSKSDPEDDPDDPRHETTQPVATAQTNGQGGDDE